MKLIGIGGTNGSGKDTLSDMLANDYGWLFISSSRDLIIPELKRRGLPLEREQMAALTAEWNRESKGAVIDMAVQEFQKQNKSNKYKGLVISSLRHPWEAERVHQLGGQVVWVDADPQIRYDRIFNRGQGDKDKKTFAQFQAEEEREKTHAGDEATLNWQGVKAQADFFLTNDSSDLSVFKARAQKQLADLL